MRDSDRCPLGDEGKIAYEQPDEIAIREGLGLFLEGRELYVHGAHDSCGRMGYHGM